MYKRCARVYIHKTLNFFTCSETKDGFMNFFKILFSALFALIVMVTQAFAVDSGAKSTDLSGKYTCSGANSDGSSAYSSPLEIKKHGDFYSFQWLSNDTGFPTDVGTGISNTDVPNSVAVVFKDVKNDKSVAVAFYQIKSDGTLQGNWGFLGDKTGGTEKCTLAKD